MKPTSSLVKIGAAVVLAMGLAACDNERPTDPQTPDVQNETQGQGDVDLYGTEPQQPGTMQGQPGTTQPGLNDPAATPPANPSTPGMGSDVNQTQQPGQGDVDLYGDDPNQANQGQTVPSASPYAPETEQREETETTPQGNQQLPARP